jgi:hypothetical protein
MTPLSLTERLLDRLKPQPKGRHRAGRAVVEDQQFLEMLWRLARALETRSIERPENLVQVLALVQRMNEIVNVTIAANAERYHRDPRLGASMKECARILGISAPSASERKKIGERIMTERLAAAGVVRVDKLGRERQVSSEVARERAAIDAAAQSAVVHIGDYLARRAA